MYSRTLEAASSARTRLERDFDPEAIRQLKAAADRDLSVGGRRPCRPGAPGRVGRRDPALRRAGRRGRREAGPAGGVRVGWSSSTSAASATAWSSSGTGHRAVSTFALIHGGGGSAWDWHLVEPELRERGHDAVAVDLPTEDSGRGLVGLRRRPSSRRSATAPTVDRRRPLARRLHCAARRASGSRSTSSSSRGDDPGARRALRRLVDEHRLRGERRRRPLYHDVPPELAAEAQASTSADKRSRRSSSPGRSRPGRTCLRATSSAAAIACSRRLGAPTRPRASRHRGRRDGRRPLRLAQSATGAGGPPGRYAS